MNMFSQQTLPGLASGRQSISKPDEIFTHEVCQKAGMLPKEACIGPD